MADVELLPLPKGSCASDMCWDAEVYTANQMHAYARANMELLQAENERLREEVELWRHKAAIHQCRRKKLAEALRDAADDLERGIDARIVVAQARAALAQEDRNG